ncbi:SDR family oxidoreductase [Alkalihalobacillus sp. AL-G]|uniref:SDR family NAD(P)-dependent oxidoreductase n=1 Tax=Alkalihalobacillus sp. AL-G TaxID=2926399 RepID=UPI00272B74B8|nr:SDR family oxidoreductase [Alkalihalobacillus sp. AL-G]WLD95415.1 SDR family oxidoreductase [Alkalihalobacillus sp. AL-G]
MSKVATRKIVVITGASSGIGAEMAYQVALKGWLPVLMARSLDKLELLQSNIEEKTGIQPIVYRLDVRDHSAVQQTFQTVDESVGRIDVLINNAGYGKFDYFTDANLDDIEGMFDTNVVGLMTCTKAVLPGMIDRRAGHIINIASQAGKIATSKSSVYAATKHAVLGFTNSLRMELEEYQIDVTAVNPGPIQTNFFEVADQSGQYQKNVERYMLQPENVASKIVDSIDRPVREINLPKWMDLGSRAYQVFPGLIEKIAGKSFKQK